MKTSIIITTYNWPEALEVVLLSVFEQIVLPDEIIIADDGSDAKTSDIINSLKNRAPVSLIHSWQNDKGFRLARSRNKAIARSQGEYLILIDGDILLGKEFIKDHLKYARPDCFVQGSRVLLNKEATERALKNKKVTVCFGDPDVGNRKNCIRSNLLSKLFSFTTTSLTGIKTCNFAFHKEDAIRVNGFNEDFVGWGREDSEFTARLLNTGLIRQNIKFNAQAYHLYHSMNSRDHLKINDAILETTIKENSIWCKNGLKQHL